MLLYLIRMLNLDRKLLIIPTIITRYSMPNTLWSILTQSAALSDQNAEFGQETPHNTNHNHQIQYAKHSVEHTHTKCCFIWSECTCLGMLLIMTVITDSLFCSKLNLDMKLLIMPTMVTRYRMPNTVCSQNTLEWGPRFETVVAPKPLYGSEIEQTNHISFSTYFADLENINISHNVAGTFRVSDQYRFLGTYPPNPSLGLILTLHPNPNPRPNPILSISLQGRDT